MKYVLLFVGTMEDQERFDAMPSEEMAAGMKAAERWFEEYSQAGKIVGGEQLKGPQTGAMVRLIGNFDIAEEVVQDSLLVALEKWPVQGIPDKPGAWLMTAARRRAIDLLRRDQRYAEKLALLERSTMPPDAPEADDRLRL